MNNTEVKNVNEEIAEGLSDAATSMQHIRCLSVVPVDIQKLISEIEQSDSSTFHKE